MNTNLRLASGNKLNKVTRQRLARIEKALCKKILAEVRRKLGKEASDRDMSKLLGKAAYIKMKRKHRVPSLIQLHKAADNIGLHLVIGLIDAKNKTGGCYYRLRLSSEFSREDLLSLMEAAQCSRNAWIASQALRELQKEILEQFKDNRQAIRWTTLIAYFAACGYEMHVWVAKNISDHEQRLLDRLNYPV